MGSSCAARLADKQYEACLVELGNAVRMDPKYHEAFNGIGLAHYYRGRNGDALESFRRASALQPKSGNYLFNVGIALVALGRLDEAKQVQNTLMSLDAAKGRDLLTKIAIAGVPKE